MKKRKNSSGYHSWSKYHKDFFFFWFVLFFPPRGNTSLKINVLVESFVKRGPAHMHHKLTIYLFARTQTGWHTSISSLRSAGNEQQLRPRRRMLSPTVLQGSPKVLFTLWVIEPTVSALRSWENCWAYTLAWDSVGKKNYSLNVHCRPLSLWSTRELMSSSSCLVSYL